MEPGTVWVPRALSVAGTPLPAPQFSEPFDHRVDSASPDAWGVLLWPRALHSPRALPLLTLVPVGLGGLLGPRQPPAWALGLPSSAFQACPVSDEPSGPGHWTDHTGHPLRPVPLACRLGQT